MDLQELYNKGYRRFKFSDGEVREPFEVKDGDHTQKLSFEVDNDGLVLWYRNDGTDNIDYGAPHVIGVEDGSTINRRDEIQRAVENGVSSSFVASAISDVEEYNDIVARVMDELDTLVERWTDEETAEDVGKGCQVREGEEYVGMRFRVNGWHEDNSPEFAGATGTVVKDDRDGAPGVKFDAPWDHLNDLKDHLFIEGSYTYLGVERMEKVEE